MNKIILFVFILFLAGCKTTENLKEIPVAQVVSQKVETMSPMEELPVIQMVEEVKEREKFYSLSVRDMALRNVLFMFSKELPEYNMVVDPDVAGVVTLNFRDLPLDKALEIILDPLGLEYTIEDNLLRVSNPRMITRTFEFVYTTSVRSSRSLIKAITGAEKALNEGDDWEKTSFGSITVQETVDVWTELKDVISQLMSTGPARLTINKRIGYITVTDYRSNIKAIEEYINLFKKSVKTQIRIRAKLLEVTLTEGSEFGINWDATLKQIGFLSGKSNPLTITQAFAPTLGLSTTITGETRTGDVAEVFQLSIDHRDFDFVIRALQSQGTVTVLSAPEVSTLNGQKAILSSVTQDVYFETTQSAGVSGGSPIVSTTSETFSYGVYIDVTPHVDSEGMITMEIHPSVSSFKGLKTGGPEATPASGPEIDIRETQTIVTIMSGETVLIAGLMQNDTNEKISKIPLLGDIPYLGKLFRRELKSDIKTELVILISATIVGPRAKDFGNIRAKYKMLKNHFP
ncbi:MAG: secretin and TonB N-terminal domain-containing protein [Candidatus Scalindua sp.]